MCSWSLMFFHAIFSSMCKKCGGCSASMVPWDVHLPKDCHREFHCHVAGTGMGMGTARLNGMKPPLRALPHALHPVCAPSLSPPSIAADCWGSCSTCLEVSLAPLKAGRAAEVHLRALAAVCLLEQ